MSVTFERIKGLASKQGLSLNQLENRLGISTNSLYGIKKANPKSDRLQEIANYFNVSTDYLLGRTDNPNIANDSAVDSPNIKVENLADNVMMFGDRELTDEKKKIIQSIIEGYLKEAEK
ncbi:helix-turn-helix domain-containing protein [Streptococcus sp. 10F2]